jgi:hypothetical protein
VWRPEPRFKTPLFYRYVRHPLYVGLLLSLWSMPVMTAGRLLFALGLSVYVLIGVAFKERDLLAQFGEHYRPYRAEVGMLMPRRKAVLRMAPSFDHSVRQTPVRRPSALPARVLRLAGRRAPARQVRLDQRRTHLLQPARPALVE